MYLKLWVLSPVSSGILKGISKQNAQAMASQRPHRAFSKISLKCSLLLVDLPIGMRNSVPRERTDLGPVSHEITVQESGTPNY